MEWDNSLVQDALIKGNYLDEEKVKESLEYAEKYNQTLGDYILTHGVLNRDLFGQAIAEHYQVMYADLNSAMPERELALKMPEEIAREFRVVIFSEDKGSYVLTTDNPKQEGLEAKASEALEGAKVQIRFSLPADIDIVLTNYRKTLETRFSKIIDEVKNVAPDIIDAIVEDAVLLHASDVHFEPRGEEVIIRFRVDGVLHESGRIAIQFYENILNRIKVQAHLRIDEHFSAQDGAIRYAHNEMEVDMRVSITPTVEGEKITIRLLSQYMRGFTVDDLGLSPKDKEILVKASKKPFGMIIVVGPTGSGKTTTMYSVLKLLNDPKINITTIEDPVEYKIYGLNQIQVNPDANVSFAHGLRSIVRQDPDVILVGEIRDPETTEIAVNAALTGHLLLSTFHANDAATAVPRLLDMGTEPFLLASTLEILLSQRLVRKICDSCRVSVQMTKADIGKVNELAKDFFEAKNTFYEGKGCSNCNDTGYNGRVGIFEFIQVDKEMEEIIMKRPSTQDIWNHASKNGSHSMFEDGVEKVKQGMTTLDELLRVVSPPE